jgi:hypothetical protein
LPGTPVIPAHRRLGFKTGLCCTMRPCLKKKIKKGIKTVFCLDNLNVKVLELNILGPQKKSEVE